EPYAAAVGIEAIDVVEDQRLVAIGIGFEVNAQRRGLAAEPAGAGVQRLAEAAALANAGRAKKEEQVQMSRGKGADIGIQFGVGGQAQGVRRHVGGRGHGWSPGVSALQSSASAKSSESQGGRRLWAQASPTLVATRATSAHRLAQRSGRGRFGQSGRPRLCVGPRARSQRTTWRL